MNFHLIAISYHNEWEQLCNKFLPLKHSNSIWRSSRNINSKDLEQGWKIHVSATILNANEIFKIVAPFLKELDIMFKATISLHELQKLNCGLYYGFSQIGKFMTIYPRSTKEAVYIAHKLHNMTCEFTSPSIPSDLPYQKNSCIFYRYGAFKTIELERSDGTRVLAIRNPHGDLVPDLREPGTAIPEWLDDPFIVKSQKETIVKEEAITPLNTTIRAYEALSHRGKGGVYRAIDLSVSPARLCILKEGRKNGEIDWDERDGFWRVKHELEVISSLSSFDVGVPEIYTYFDVESNFYVAMELIEGRNLQSILTKKLRIKDALQYGVQIARLLHKIHSAGWVWRDCKPMNLIINKEGIIRPIDFEGACLIDQFDTTPWGTPGYLPPQSDQNINTNSHLPEDLYALGATLHQLFSGQIPQASALLPIGKLRRQIPPSVRRIIAELLDPQPENRPDAKTVLQTLETAFSENYRESLDILNNNLYRATSF